MNTRLLLSERPHPCDNWCQMWGIDLHIVQSVNENARSVQHSGYLWVQGYLHWLHWKCVELTGE